MIWFVIEACRMLFMVSASLAIISPALLLALSMDAMRALGGSLDAAGIDRDKMQADQAVTKDLMGPTLSGIMTQIVEEKPKEINASTQAYLDRMDQTYFVCDGCGYIGKGETPVKCPVCGVDGTKFKQVDKKIFEVAATSEGELERDVA